jgi:hypothetical protein
MNLVYNEEIKSYDLHTIFKYYVINKSLFKILFKKKAF